jgi:hypothetical protein
VFGSGLKKVGLPEGHLDRIGAGANQHIDHAGHILKPVQKAGFIADAVIDSHVKATAVAEKPVHPDLGQDFHG